MALKIEDSLDCLSTVLKENGFFAANMIVEQAIASILDLRDRIDELGGYHDDV